MRQYPELGRQNVLIFGQSFGEVLFDPCVLSFRRDNVEVILIGVELVSQRLESVIALREKPFDVSFDKGILTLDSVFDQFLEFTQLYLHKDVIHILVFGLVKEIHFIVLAA